jgi:hypothetical protein
MPQDSTRPTDSTIDLAPIAATTMGDPCGIGPEIVLRSLAARPPDASA